MYKLRFPHEKNILLNPNKNSVQGIYPIRLKSNDDLVICIRQKRTISGYKFIPENTSWIQLWNEMVFAKEGNYPLDSYPWLVTDKILPDEDVIILKHPEGIRFYVPDLKKRGLKLLKEDGHFHDVYGYKILWGRFYPDSNELGVTTRKYNGDVKFFAISNDSLWPNTTNPVFPAAIDVPNTTSWSSQKTDLMLAGLLNGQDVFILRTSNSLEIFKFNDDYILNHILDVPDLKKRNETTLDHILFANLTKQPYRDLLYFNTSGMYVYQYNSKENNYITIHKNTAEEFKDCIKSMKIADINNDGKDEILFTGYNGLKALQFENNNTWTTVLNTDLLPGAQKYSNIIGILPPLSSKVSHTSVFMQDLEGNIQWANIIPDNKPNNAIFNYSTELPMNEILSYNEIPERDNVVYPKQIPRSLLLEKPTLRWTEQWDDNFLLKSVDAGNGHVRFSVPLADLTTLTGWGLKLALLYNSNEMTANQLGIGWSMSINTDYIYVDHQGSIYPEDFQYFLMIQGNPQLLKLVSTSGNTQSYQIANYSDEKITIKYNKLDETWIIENENEQTIYGKTKFPLAEDILHWGMEWPNWRGAGTDQTQLKPVVQAWYINTRLDKTKNSYLYYYYDVEKSTLTNGKLYTTDIRLKAIKGNDMSKIIFTYAEKYKDEYTKVEPIDSKGIITFPVPLTEKDYLKEIRIATPLYQQIFLINYEVKNKKRFLKNINQQINSKLESLLQFDYKPLLEEDVLVMCKTSKLSVNFDYKLLAPAIPSFDVQTYQFLEKPKIFYGPDYTIVAYQNKSTMKLVFRIMDQKMTKLDVEVYLNIPGHESLEGFQIFSYNNSFSVLTSTKKNHTLYFYTRKNEEWSIQHKTYQFNIKSLPRFGESMIAFWDKDIQKIKIIEYNESEFKWKESNINLSSPINYFAIHNKVIAGYDNNNLWVFYKDEKSNWQNRKLKSNLGRLDQIVDIFDLDQEFKDQWIEGLKQSALQINNNVIVLNSMQESNGNIYLHIHLFLLDAKFNLVKYEKLVEWRENVNNLVEDLTNEGSTFTLKYNKVNGRHTLKIINISGKVAEQLESIRNKNRRQDRKEELLDMLNKLDGWKDILKKKILLNWNLYRIYPSSQGVSCGDDILFRFTGTNWKKETFKFSEQLQPLGKHFLLESTERDKISLKLYKQDNNKQKQGQPLMNIDVVQSGAFINKYPYYIAYQNTIDEIAVVTFKNQKTLNQTYYYRNEELLPESDWRNILTLKKTSNLYKLKTIPLVTVVTPEKRAFVKKITISDGNETRSTGYDRMFNTRFKKFVETTKIIPADNIKVSGWIELTRTYDIYTGNLTKTENNYDANGKLVLNPTENDSTENGSTNPNEFIEKSPMILYDQSGKLEICNFSPYSLSSDMIDYYGFETYEEDHINKALVWKSKDVAIVKDGFSFTGKNYLEIGSAKKNPGFLEKEYKPFNQRIVYVAACWIRCNAPLDLFSPVSYLKATIKTTIGQKLITLLGQVKQQQGDWYYVELPIDFENVNLVYEQYLTYMIKTASNSTVNALPQMNSVEYTITLRIESDVGDKIDVDHIRFAPIDFEFEASVYNSLTKKQTATIQSNGLATRVIYNNFNEEIASLQEDGQVEQLITNTKCGYLFSIIDSIPKQNPSQVTFEPTSGFYEIFDKLALRSRWTLNDPNAWNIAPGQLWHKASIGHHRLEADPRLFDKSNAAIRFSYSMVSTDSMLSLTWKAIGSLKIHRNKNFVTGKLPDNTLIKYLPTDGEAIIMINENHLWLWVNGVLLVDKIITNVKQPYNPWSSFALEFNGHILVEDLFVMNKPSVQIEYYNAFGDKTQVIQLESTHSVLVTESLYDEIGREAITTKTSRIHRQSTAPLLKQHHNFVTNKYQNSKNSVWRTGKLQGEVDQLNLNDHGFAYRRTEFEKNPLNEEKTIGLPGSDFAITGKYATKKSQESNISFLSNLFPSRQGYRQKVVNTPNGAIKVSVFDKFKNKVAQYIRVPSYNHLLSIYEYDSENRLVKILPPLYHEKVKTSIQLTPWQAGEQHLTTYQKEYQYLLATKIVYNENGQLIRKVTPDTGITEYLYNSMGQMRFMVSLNSNNSTENIVYYDYDAQSQIIRSGYIDKPLPLKTLRDHLDSVELPYSQDYQLFDYADTDINPIKRGRTKNFITYNFGGPVIEKVQFNKQQQIEEKDMILDRNDNDKFTKIKKSYIGKKLSVVTYPPFGNNKQLKLVHRYNQLGQLISIATGIDSPIIDFYYDANGQLESEHHHLNNFTRNYRYNSPGFLHELSDPFETEYIKYTENGYGHKGYGDGMIMQTTFIANWANNADSRWFKVTEEEIGAVCLRALKRTGHLSNNNLPLKMYIQEMESKIPLECDGNRIAKLIAEKMMPQYYGFRYAYGNHQELVRAKYFSNKAEEFIGPLQPDTFANEIPGISREHSFIIWKQLSDNYFITTDNERNDIKVSVGFRGISIFRDKDLMDDLKKLNDNFILYLEPIKQLILRAIAYRKLLTVAEFEEIFLSWEGIDETSNLIIINQKKNKAKTIGNMLLKKGYIGTSGLHALDQKFISALKQYTKHIPDIIKILLVQFAHSLGTTAFDVESFKIDPNGNHKLFWTGFNRYELSYMNNTNKIENVVLNLNATNEKLPMKHDAVGNVIQASHKGIEKIEYHPVSQRTTFIKLMDGRTIQFFYDAQGERVLKQVFLPDGTLKYERQYLRDEKGRVLADRVIKYTSGETNQVVTGYLYGPKGLLGFVRKNKFYSVTTDHIGSIRLVIRDGQVVAAYDYLPYGQLMRSYGNDPDAQIVYRYTGQEWDEETNLYNFHARLFDPSIGRFYQPDPKSQYFSPYKYAGNSPVALIDPDGEFAFIFLFAALFALGGAYLGGAAANNRWNPLDWDYSDPGTYLGIGGGALAGFFLPIGAVASAGTIGIGATVLLGAGGAYVMTAAANNNWNPAKWKWDRPGTWNALFQGFGAGSGFFGGIGSAHNFAKTVFAGNKLGKVLFLGVSYTVAGATTYGAGVIASDGEFAFWKWDPTNPATWAALIDGFNSGMGWPQGVLEIGRGFHKIAKNPKLLGSMMGKSTARLQKLKAILKNPKHPLYKTTGGIVMTYFMGSSANGEFDITRWNFASYSTYEGIINGVFSGKDTASLLKYARQSKIKLPKLKLNILKRIKNYNKNYYKNINKQLKNIISIRKKIEYNRLINDLFSNRKLQSKLLKTLKSTNSKKHIETFLKDGKKKLNNGQNKVPRELDTILTKEVDNNVKSNELAEWHRTADELDAKKNEIYPEDGADFLSCSGRKRRGLKRSHCMITKQKDQNEVVENFFDIKVDVQNKFKQIDVGDKKVNLDYKEKFSSRLLATPNVLAGSKPNFLSDFVFGSLLTSQNAGLINVQKSVFVKYEEMKFSSVSDRKVNHSILKTSFKTEINGATYLVLKSYITEPYYISANTGTQKDNLRQNFLDNLHTEFKYSKSEIDQLKTKLDIKGDFYIKEEMFYVDKENKLYSNDKTKSYKNYEYDTSQKVNSEFQEIKPVSDLNLENHLKKLSNKNIDVVKDGTTNLMKDLLKAFNENREILQLGKKVAESRFHSFLYGALSMNFQKRYKLDVFIERISGRGYVDMVLLSRLFNEKTSILHAIPIAIELKSDGTSAKSAVDQAIGTSYLNNLSLRTVAEKALIVGMDFKKPDIIVQEAIIPVNKNIFKEPIKHIQRETIEAGLQYKYNSISPLAIKTPSSQNDHYFSRLLIGELIATVDTKPFVKHHVDGDFKDKLTTFFYKDAKSNEWVMLNVVENSLKKGNEFIYEDVDLSKLKLEIAPSLNIKEFTRIDIKLNNRSKSGWTPEQPKRTDDKSAVQNDKNLYCLQDIKIEKLQVNDVNTIKPDTFTYKEITPIDVDKIFNTESKKNDNGLSVELFENVDFKNNLKKMKDFINSESDIQGYIQGLLMSNKASDGSLIKVFPEVNPAAGTRIDLGILKYRKIGKYLFDEHLIISELKYAKTTADVENKLKEAQNQLLHYRHNLDSLTDLKVYTPLAIVYNKETGTITYNAKPASEIVQSSKSVIDEDLSPALKKLKLNKRSIHNFERNSSEDCRITQEHIPETITGVSSGSSRIQFWPLQLVRKAHSSILSIVTALWIAAPAEKPTPYPNEKYWTEQDTTFETINSTPSMLEMGDKWLQSTDLNSNLTLGILIARKLTGYRPKPPKYHTLDDNNIELGLQATELVNSFMKMVTTEAEAIGLNDYDIFDNSTTYYEAIQMIRCMLNTGDIHNIPRQLYIQIIQKNIKHFSSKTSKLTITNFDNNVKKTISKWSLQNLYSEKENNTQIGMKRSIDDTIQNSENTEKLTNTTLYNKMNFISSSSCLLE